jgi:hypothetical protein
MMTEENRIDKTAVRIALQKHHAYAAYPLNAKELVASRY